MEIERIGPEELPLYATISIAYSVETVYRVRLIERGLGGIVLAEEHVEHPYLKDYDALSEGGPERWSTRFDLGGWGLFLAREKGKPVGGAAVATRTPELGCVEGKFAVLWDLRVHPDFRGLEIGKTLFRYAADWSAGQSFQQLKIETQTHNVPACQFYVRQGCYLGSLDRFGYAGSRDETNHPVAEETMLIWYLDL